MQQFNARRRLRILTTYGGRHPLPVLLIIYTLVTIAISGLWVFWSPFIDSFTNNPQTTGLISSLFVFIGILYALVLPRTISGMTHKGVFLLGLCIAGLSVIAIAFVNDLLSVILLSLLMFAGFMFHGLGLATLTRDASTKKTISKNQGVRWFFGNIAFFIGPLLMAFIFTGNNYKPLLLLVGGLLLGGALLGLIIIKPTQPTRHAHQKPDFIGYWKNKDRRLAYALRFGLSMLMGYAYTYMPLMILYSGKPSSWIGFSMFAIVIPLIILEVPISRAAPVLKYKNVFFWGFLIAAVLLFASGFAQNLTLMLALIVGSMVGVAFLEPTIEAYFFLRTKREDEHKYLGTYLTSDRVGNLFGKLIGALALFFIPLTQITIIYGACLLVFAFIGRTATK